MLILFKITARILAHENIAYHLRSNYLHTITVPKQEYVCPLYDIFLHDDLLV